MLAIRFEFSGQDFPLVFLYKNEQRVVHIYRDNELNEKIGVRTEDEFMKLVKSTVKGMLTRHERELLESEVFLGAWLNGFNYFVVGEDHRVKESKEV